MKKRILSFLLMLVMVVSMVPVMATATAAEETAEAPTADDLYVTDGLVAWFDAFGANDASVDLANSSWKSKVGESSAQLYDNSGAAAWAYGADGKGVAYSFATMASLASDLNKIGMYLPTNLLADSNMAIEFVFHVNPVMKDGKPVCGVKEDKASTDTVLYEKVDKDRYRWGIYNAAPVSSFSFAGLNMCQFHWVDYDGAAVTSRFYYAQGSWENFGGDAGGTRNMIGINLVGNKETGYDPTTMALTFNRTVTDGAEYKNAQFDLYKNGSAFCTVKNDKGSSNQRKFWTLDELAKQASGYTAFHAFFAMPSTVYAIRMYDHALTAAERNQNHFADLAKFYGLDLSSLVGKSAEELAEVFSMTSTIGFDSTKDALQLAVDRAADLQGVVESSITAYDKLYAAKDNLIVLLTAFDASDLSVDLTTGRWYNKATKGENFATLVDSASATSWEYAKDGKGIEYSFATIGDLVGNLTTIGLRIPTADFTDADMASEYVFAVNPTLDENGNQVKITMKEDGNPSHGGKYGVYNGSGKSNFSFAGLQICHFTLTENPNGSSMKDRIFYAPGPWEGGWGTKDANNNDARRYDEGFLFGTEKGWNENIVTLGFNRTVTARPGDFAQADFNILLDGVSKYTVSNLKHPGSANQYKFYTINQLDKWTASGSTSSAADAFFGIPSTVYAVRVYDKTLNATEMALNRAVDLMAFYGLDVSKIANVPEGVLSSIGSAFAGYGYEATAEEQAAMQAAIDDIAAVYAEMVAAQELSEYDNLYVKDGMTLLLSAYSADDASLALDRGMWYNKLDYSYATLLDGGNAEKYGWKAGENGGIYYRIPTVAEFNSVNSKTGMTLPGNVLNDGDFTVEFVFDALGISGDDNVIQPHTGASGESKYGAYSGPRSSFAIAGLQMTMFHYSTLSTGNSMAVRAFYFRQQWDGEANGKVTYADLRNIFGTSTDINKSEWKDGIMTFVVDRTVAAGADYTLTEFVGTVGADSFTVNNGTGVTDGKIDHTFFTVNSIARPFEAFIGMPAQVYAVRAYNRTLTAAEKAQNHFADVAAYLGLNTFGVEFLEGAKAAAFYDLFADADFTSDKDVLQNKIFGALAALDVLMGAGEAEATVTEDDLVITATYGAASMPLGSLAMLGFTVEMGVVLAPITSEDMTAADITVVRGENAFTPSLETSLVLVNYSSEEESAYVTGENFFAPMGVMFQMALSYKDVVVANGLEAMVKAPLVFRGFIAITDAEGNTSIIYNDDVTSKSFYGFADYYVNEFEGDKYLMHDYNINETLVGIIGAENVKREIGLDVKDEDQTQTTDKDAALGDIPETGITGAEDIKQDGEDDVASTQVDKIRPTADSNASYSFVSTVDGKVRLVIEYVAKAYTLGDRAITIKVDGYKTMTVVLSDSVTGINTDRNNHGFYVVEFEVAAGTHNIVIGAAEGARAVEIFSIAVDAQ